MFPQVWFALLVIGMSASSHAQTSSRLKIHPNPQPARRVTEERAQPLPKNPPPPAEAKNGRLAPIENYKDMRFSDFLLKTKGDFNSPHIIHLAIRIPPKTAWKEKLIQVPTGHGPIPCTLKIQQERMIDKYIPANPKKGITESYSSVKEITPTDSVPEEVFSAHPRLTILDGMVFNGTNGRKLIFKCKDLKNPHYVDYDVPLSELRIGNFNLALQTANAGNLEIYENIPNRFYVAPSYVRPLEN